MSKLYVFSIFYRVNLFIFSLIVFLSLIINGPYGINNIVLIAILSEITSNVYHLNYKKNEFYFYYNFRLSKIKLFTFSFITTLLLSFLILITYNYVFIRN